MKHFYLLAFMLTAIIPAAFTQSARFAIELTDKDTINNPYDLSTPGDFLSDRALERRDRYNIPLENSDLPLSPRYVDSLRPFLNSIQNKSKWMNAVIAEADSTKLDSIRSLSFVKRIKYLAPAVPESSKKDHKGIQGNDTTNLTEEVMVSDSAFYGQTWNQTKMLNGHLLHQSNYRGEGMVIAVFDAGFQNVDQLPAFNNLWENDQILGVRDFEDKDGMVFDSHVHGTMVLSVMSVNMPETYVGTAPAAKYWLLRTEVGNSEYLIEEYNWLAAAEFADSAGVDLINSSLGYTTFDDTSQNHTYQDMDGFSTPVSKAASMAASKGILVVNSAGNLGNSAWHYISAPADADSIMSVGAVDPFSQYVSFSSTGPTADGRIKPDVSAQGMSTATQYVDSSFVMGNGTSLSAPLITGLTACLWQKYPELSNIEIINKIRRSSHQYSNPDSLLGYGIPNFAEAGEVGINELKKSSVKIFPNPFKNRFYINIPDVRLGDNPIYLNIYNMMGKKIYTRGLSNSAAGSHIRINALSNQPPGIYLIKLTIEPDYIIKQKLVKY